MKIRLRQTFGAHAGRTCDFDRDVISLGRLPTSDFAFDPYADLDASGAHAELRYEQGRWIVRDVGSRNGTFVNGARVQSQAVLDGDEIEFGMGGPRVRVEGIVSAPVTLAATSMPAPSSGVAPPAALPAPSAAPLPSPVLADRVDPAASETSHAWAWALGGGCALLVLFGSCIACIAAALVLGRMH